MYIHIYVSTLFVDNSAPTIAALSTHNRSRQPSVVTCAKCQFVSSRVCWFFSAPRVSVLCNNLGSLRINQKVPRST